MLEVKRGRGRPKGSEKPEDREVLVKAAELMIAEPTLKHTTAFRRLRFNVGDSEIRRLQRKWKRDGASLIAEKRRRAVVASTGRGVSVPVSSYHDRGAIAEANKLTEQANACASLVEQARKIAKLISEQDRLQGLTAGNFATGLSNPYIDMMRKIENDPVMKMVREHQRIIDMVTRGY